MDLEQDIQVITQKDKNVSPEARHKWRMPKLPPVPKAINFYTLIESPEADITAIHVVRPESFPASHNRDIPVSVKKLVHGRKEEALWLGTMSSYLQVKNFMGQEKTEELLRG
ncbi:hypothetical protein O181_110302 [Austropuccinia psidii MF-1]|uniref:Uncharacterized protein n=1 Tax=Austropuccinia psidii MF-1 TaxID=1389203 RepID=A0A9Q3JZI1_9BASI|nr:hypothetical protein [Austropuccinia psidii MF-1]